MSSTGLGGRTGRGTASKDASPGPDEGDPSVGRDAPRRRPGRVRRSRAALRRRRRPALVACLLLAVAAIVVARGGPATRAPEAGRPLPVVDDGLWVSRDRVRRLPTSGPAWRHVLQRADERGTPDLADPGAKHHANVLANALVAVRLDDDVRRARVRDDLRALVRGGADADISVLGPARQLASYVIAADLVELARFDADVDRAFRAWIDGIRTQVFSGTDDPALSIVGAHEQRPNNFGTAAGAARIAIDGYLGDERDLRRAATVFRAWLGERALHAGFAFGDLAWQADPARPVGVNPRGATRVIDGRARDVDGVLPEEQRRQGAVTWPPRPEPYVYAGLQGAVAQAELLRRHGYDTWSWSDEALRRAVGWLYGGHFGSGRDYPAVGTSAEWILPLVNLRYRTEYAWEPGFWRGQIVGFTDWTHGAGR